ncbi:MAG TPA: hypothetical protein VMF10_01890 [Candidatus Aquilonibacter sp.]|nr:hypothetical protein [Candidatus Aquilonibacter sp.]
MTKPNRKRIDEPKYLSGWKEISNYLGKGVRTVQRYEHSMGLPVRRPAGKLRAAVVATEAELDAWVAASPIRWEFQLAGAQNGSASYAPSIKSGVEEMRRLRDQMQALRDELRNSVGVLRSSIEALESEASNRSWNNERRGFTMLDSTFRSDQIYRMLASDSGNKRAS